MKEVKKVQSDWSCIQNAEEVINEGVCSAKKQNEKKLASLMATSILLLILLIQ